MSRHIVLHNYLPKRKTKDDAKEDRMVKWHKEGRLRYGESQNMTKAELLADAKQNGADMWGQEAYVAGYMGEKKRRGGAKDTNNFTSQKTWEAAVKINHPSAEIKWNGDQVYTAVVNGKEVGRFNYGQIRGGDLMRGNGWVDNAKDAVIPPRSAAKVTPAREMSRKEIEEELASGKFKGPLPAVRKQALQTALSEKKMRGEDYAALPPFDQWMRNVDKYAYAIAGVSVHDLPDCPFRDWYDARVNERSAANRALKRAKSGDSAHDAPEDNIDKQIEDLTRIMKTGNAKQQAEARTTLIKLQGVVAKRAGKDAAYVIPARLNVASVGKKRAAG